MTAVVRVGDTVRRRAGPWTPAVHALLRHLRASGFWQAPEPLGIDPQGREILTLLPGRVATYPLPDFVWSDDTLVSVARLLAAYHDATVGFVPPAGAVWQWPAHPARSGSGRLISRSRWSATTTSPPTTCCSRTSGSPA